MFPSGRPSVKSKDLQVIVLGTFDAKSKQSLRVVANDVGVGNLAIYIKATFFLQWHNGPMCAVCHTMAPKIDIAMDVLGCCE